MQLAFFETLVKQGGGTGLLIGACLLKGSLTAGVGGEGTCGGSDGEGGEKFQSAPRVHTAFAPHGLVIIVHVLRSCKFGFLPIDTPRLIICVYIDDRCNLRATILQTVYLHFITISR